MTDPDEIQKFRDHCVTIDPEEKKETWTAAFSPAAMSRSPVIADAAKEIYSEAEAAIGKFYDGTLSAEELSDTYLSGLSPYGSSPIFIRRAGVNFGYEKKHCTI